MFFLGKDISMLVYMYYIRHWFPRRSMLRLWGVRGSSLTLSAGTDYSFAVFSIISPLPSGRNATTMDIKCQKLLPWPPICFGQDSTDTNKHSSEYCDVLVRGIYELKISWRLMTRGSKSEVEDMNHKYISWSSLEWFYLLFSLQHVNVSPKYTKHTPKIQG